MKKIATATATVLAAAVLFGAQAQAAGHGASPYVYDSQKQVVRDGVKRCVLNGHIPLTPENATEECNPELIKRAEAPAPAPTPAPTPAPVPEVKAVTLDANTYFDFDKYNLKPAGKQALDELVREMGDLSDIAKIMVVGHTDSIGTAAYNQGLSERRANTVRNYLIEKGVDAGKIEAIGRGESQPVADNSTREGRAQNRRVEVSIEGKVRQ